LSFNFQVERRRRKIDKTETKYTAWAFGNTGICFKKKKKQKHNLTPQFLPILKNKQNPSTTPFSNLADGFLFM